MKKLFAVFSLALFSTLALAQEAVATAQPDKVVSFLDKLNAAIPTEGKIALFVAWALGGIADISLRVWKTQKPIDLLLMLGNLLKRGGRIGDAFSKLCYKGSDFMDKVLPQNSVEAKPEKVIEKAA